MNNLRKKISLSYRVACLTFIPLLSFLLLIGIYDHTVPNLSAPEAKHGTLDLSQWDFGKGGFVNLDGEWSFYPNQLLTPDDFRSGGALPAAAAYPDIPNAWFDGTPPDQASQAQYGTYRLAVKLKESDGSYGIRVSNVLMAHRLYVNGMLFGQKGHPASDVQSYEAGNTPYTTFVRVEGRELDIVMQVANFTYVNGGGFEELQLGSQADMLMMDRIKFAVEFSGLFILLLFGGYHLSIYVLRLQDKAYLYSALYFLTLLSMILVSGDQLVLQLFPEISYEASQKVYNLGGFLNIVVLGIFLFHLDRKLLTRRHLFVLLTPIAVYLVAVLIFPTSLYARVGNLPWNYAMLLVAFYLYRAIRLYVKQDGKLDRKEAALLIGVLVSIASILLFGLFYFLGWVQTDLGRRLAFLAVIMFMNTLLALRLTHATELTERLTEQLILRDKLKDEFLANTSHELKTPLHGIQNMTTHLLDGKAGALTERQRSELLLIHDTSTKLSALVNDLVDVVRLKQGDFQLQATVLDLRVAAQTAFQVLEFELAGKEVRWENRIAPGTFATADENRVRQVLYNLIHNAIKHTKQGWIEVSASVADGRVIVSVEDTGIGIPPDRHEEIFGYFVQAERALPNDGYTGMGLGLHIGRQLVERMGGTMFVERSELGRGTRMTFTLQAAPLAAAATEAELSLADRRGLMAPARAADLDIVNSSRTSTVLIVDDEASNVRILLNLLGEEHNLLTAFSAKEALHKLEEHPQIDLLILDVMMPEMSGIDLCRTIRETRSVLELPILFATVKDSPHDIELCFRAGGNDFIAKPFDQKTLAARVRTLLSMKTSMDQAIKSELAFLQAQIKPHFLYNAISSIISFCYSDGEKAAHLLSMLSRYLQMVFQRDHQTLHVPLQMELKLIHAYVEIEKARFGERLAFNLQVDPGVESVCIPSLTIQPFVENAIRHGLFDKAGPGTVTLSIADGDGYVRVEIVDDGVGMADDLLYLLRAGDRAEGTGIGMTNIRRRLAAIRGASMAIDSALERGTKVIVYLPKQEQ
ncbi:ATP-binding protein [Tumebacillus lipolyticus]|uniref:histidine kinase n=1 Tax=Tumebacillus lipolyticus TaxID=1280370 RepID=A0ABW4ZXY6_9BACL